MQEMKKTTIVFFLLCAVFVQVHAQSSQNQQYLQYIAQWRDVAVDNQKHYGIPASIIMAQALLESAAGTSELATRANNHFGIKCTSDWTGKTYHKDDDRKDDCFRVYKNASQSFDDHAVFLQRSRYQSLFEIAVEDYEGWAYGLKRCGYATDPNYPQKLIKLIQDYRLDCLTNKNWETVCNTRNNPSTDRPVVVKKNDPIAIITSNPEPEYVEPLSASKEKKQFFKSHQKQKCNGVKYVLAQEGDTYATVAFSLNVRERDLREQNDALGRTLQPGDRIYLSKKKSQAPKEKTLMWVTPGETLWEICQREGVQMKKVQQYNNFAPSIRVLKTRQAIYLRKPKKDK
ncbi:MAG: glucosaminidase domain-containing protein [Paludibacteraceae bacterium]